MMFNTTLLRMTGICTIEGMKELHEFIVVVECDRLTLFTKP